MSRLVSRSFKTERLSYFLRPLAIATRIFIFEPLLYTVKGTIVNPFWPSASASFAILFGEEQAACAATFVLLWSVGRLVGGDVHAHNVGLEAAAPPARAHYYMCALELAVFGAERLYLVAEQL